MKRIFLSITAIALVLASCTETKTDSESTTNSEVAAGTMESPAPVAITIDEASWESKDLKTTSDMIPVTLNVPKDATMEKNGNGGVDIRINEASIITVSNMAVGSIKEILDAKKSLTVDNKSYINTKIVQEEENGFVYTIQMKDEENGTKYQPEFHFVYALKGDGGLFYEVADERPMDNYSLAGGTYTEENAKKMYESAKNSAKVK